MASFTSSGATSPPVLSGVVRLSPPVNEPIPSDLPGTMEHAELKARVTSMAIERVSPVVEA